MYSCSLSPYHWAYKKGFVDGMKESSYFGGYADGQSDAFKFATDSYRKFFDNPELRQNGKINKDEDPTPDPKLP